jgi:hypothetical protein
MGKVNINVLLNEYKILMCIWNYVLLHQMDKILSIQKLTLVPMYNNNSINVIFIARYLLLTIKMKK